ncbi:hypothetical protein DMW99_07680 [Pseudomonas chlororaphis]|nr:hypothetical protein C1Y36_28065 [Pseudomonas sp. FW306-2-2C-D06C]PYC39151.1 hypothetical protein DMW99_07680 [Pseudomonas chlororaphis]
MDGFLGKTCAPRGCAEKDAEDGAFRRFYPAPIIVAERVVMDKACPQPVQRPGPSIDPATVFLRVA